MNLRRPKTFILAVVPLGQIAINFGNGGETGQVTGAGGALGWTGEDLRKGQSGDTFSKKASVAFASLSQRQIGKAGMAASEAPGRFAVSRKIKHRKNITDVWLG